MNLKEEKKSGGEAQHGKSGKIEERRALGGPEPVNNRRSRLK